MVQVDDLIRGSLEFVLRAGVPIVAFGQGIGPITDPVLLAKTKAVFPRLKLIGLREGNQGLALLESLGVPRERIHVTGDDAIEIAFQHRPSSLGDAIGINVRLAGYAGTGEEMIARLREPLRSAAQALNSSLISVPISLHESDSDVKSADRILGGQCHDSLATTEEPKDVIRLIGRCGVVVTGSYHSGVFALAQGIPVIGLVNSPYYEQKFTGLQKQFPGGCRLLDFRQSVASSEIQDAICRAWESAEQMREPLLRAAAYQVELSRATYKTANSLLPLDSDG
jgi:colanic acid/amylovoran biosynthesis protein